jgi:hypothetical protein
MPIKTDKKIEHLPLPQDCVVLVKKKDYKLIQIGRGRLLKASLNRFVASCAPTEELARKARTYGLGDKEHRIIENALYNFIQNKNAFKNTDSVSKVLICGNEMTKIDSKNFSTLSNHSFTAGGDNSALFMFYAKRMIDLALSISAPVFASNIRIAKSNQTFASRPWGEPATFFAPEVESICGKIAHVTRHSCAAKMTFYGVPLYTHICNLINSTLRAKQYNVLQSNIFKVEINPHNLCFRNSSVGAAFENEFSQLFGVVNHVYLQTFLCRNNAVNSIGFRLISESGAKTPIVLYKERKEKDNDLRCAIETTDKIDISAKSARSTASRQIGISPASTVHCFLINTILTDTGRKFRLCLDSDRFLKENKCLSSDLYYKPRLWSFSKRHPDASEIFYEEKLQSVRLSYSLTRVGIANELSLVDGHYFANSSVIANGSWVFIKTAEGSLGGKFFVTQKGSFYYWSLHSGGEFKFFDKSKSLTILEKKILNKMKSQALCVVLNQTESYFDFSFGGLDHQPEIDSLNLVLLNSSFEVMSMNSLLKNVHTRPMLPGERMIHDRNRSKIFQQIGRKVEDLSEFLEYAKNISTVNFGPLFLLSDNVMENLIKYNLFNIGSLTSFELAMTNGHAPYLYGFLPVSKEKVFIPRTSPEHILQVESTTSQVITGREVGNIFATCVVKDLPCEFIEAFDSFDEHIANEKKYSLKRMTGVVANEIMNYKMAKATNKPIALKFEEDGFSINVEI